MPLTNKLTQILLPKYLPTRFMLRVILTLVNRKNGTGVNSRASPAP